MGDFAIPLTWPGQKITVPEDMRDLMSGAEQVSGLGHAGIVLVDGNSGRTKYYEYGRYNQSATGADQGQIRSFAVKDLQIVDGRITGSSLEAMLAGMLGSRGPIMGAVLGASEGGFAKGIAFVNDPQNGYTGNYSILGQHCYTFTVDVSSAMGTWQDWYDGISGFMPTAAMAQIHSIRGGFIYDPRTGKIFDFDSNVDGTQCFPAGTLITLADGSKKAIELITASDKVLTFDDKGNRRVGEVVRTYINTTPEFIRLIFDDGRDDLVATPGHAFKTETGDYLELGHLARLGGGTVRLVDIDGMVITAKAERLVYSSDTAHLFATSVNRSMTIAGNLAFKEDVTEGWATHNFEVRTTHNYVAGDIRVHNRLGTIGSLGDSLDHNLDRLGGVRDGDGSFLDRSSDLINAGLHMVDRAMRSVSDGFSNIGNSIAVGMSGVASSIAGAVGAVVSVIGTAASAVGSFFRGNRIEYNFTSITGSN